MNRISIIALVVIFSFCSKTYGQLNHEEALVPNPNKFSLGVGIGLATMYGDLNTHIPTLAERIGFGFHLTHSLLLGVEFYTGTLSSKEPQNTWTTGLASTSRFYSVDLNAKVTLSTFFSNSESWLSKFLKGFYIGSGIGYINVNVLSITDTMKKNIPNDTSIKRAIKRHDEQPYIPLNIGVRLPLKKFLGTRNTMLMVNYNMCYAFSDYIDGYNFALISTQNNANKFNDVYSVLTVGFSFALGKTKNSFHYFKHKPAK